ncbi:MAG: hypothetical protein QM770_10380 [Tepidisphaeraceae bacterium]
MRLSIGKRQTAVTMTGMLRRALTGFAKGVLYAALGLSLLVWMGTMFGAAFTTSFDVVNRTTRSIVVTPIGTMDGRLSPLPTTLRFMGFPAWRGSISPRARRAEDDPLRHGR